MAPVCKYTWEKCEILGFPLYTEGVVGNRNCSSLHRRHKFSRFAHQSANSFQFFSNCISFLKLLFCEHSKNRYKIFFYIFFLKRNQYFILFHPYFIHFYIYFNSRFSSILRSVANKTLKQQFPLESETLEIVIMIRQSPNILNF